MAKKSSKKPAAKQPPSKFQAGVIAVAAVTAVLTALATGVTDGIKDTTKNLTKQGITWIEGGYEWVFPPALPQADGSKLLSIFVARLDGDPGKTETRHLARALANVFDKPKEIEVRIIPRTIREGTSGEVFRDRQQGEDAARDLLRHSGAHILIWGNALEKNKLHIFVTVNEGQSPTTTRNLEVSKLELPAGFEEDLGLAIAGRMGAATAFDEGDFVADLLDELYPRLKALAGQKLMQQGKTACEVNLVLADVGQSLGTQKGENEQLIEAIEGYKRIAANEPCMADKGFRPLVLNNLANALTALGERESGTARLEEAIAVYRGALKEYTLKGTPGEWASTQHNLGSALTELGERENGTARFEEAIAAYREALKVYTREQAPRDWAMTQNSIGAALRVVGLREGNMARIEEAVGLYRETLKVRTREDVPLQWARTQNHLGSALATLGERENDTARLKEAAEAYRKALQEYPRDRLPLDWAIAQNNLGEALRALGERESGTARLDEAEAALRSALEIFEGRADAYAATAHRNLARVKALLDERRTKPN